MNEGRRLDYWVPAEVGVPVDVGWGFIVVNADETVTRTCKGCGASVTSAMQLVGAMYEVEQRPFVHRDGCQVWPRLGNNPGTS